MVNQRERRRDYAHPVDKLKKDCCAGMMGQKAEDRVSDPDPHGSALI